MVLGCGSTTTTFLQRWDEKGIELQRHVSAFEGLTACRLVPYGGGSPPGAQQLRDGATVMVLPVLATHVMIMGRCDGGDYDGAGDVDNDRDVDLTHVLRKLKVTVTAGALAGHHVSVLCWVADGGDAREGCISRFPPVPVLCQ